MAPRVLMFGWEFPPYNSGGLGTACEGLTRALAAQKVSTIFVLPRRYDLKARFLKFRFAEIENFILKTLPGLLYPYITAENYARDYEAAASPLYGRSLLEEVYLYARRARKIAQEEAYDIIHAHDWLSFPAGLAARAASGKPLIVHVHATEFDRSGGHQVNPAVYEIERQGMHQADAICAVSHWTKKIITDHYAVPAEKVHVVHNGIELEKYAPLATTLESLRAAGNKIVLFIGRITLQKGPDYFVRAAKRVLDFEPKTYFVMAGSGDMENQMIRLVAELGLSSHFIFPGFLRGEELNRLYQAADLYVLPSVSEPFGITPLEALANGTPVLVSKQSGVAEVLNHALKVDFWDVEEMANQIVAVLRHSVLQNTLAQQGRVEAGRLSWAQAARQCLALYSSLCYNPLA